MEESPDKHLPPRARFIADLARHRAKARWGKGRLAKEMGCHHSYVSHVELGRRAPSISFAEDADRAFGLDGHFVKLYEEIVASTALGWFGEWMAEVEPAAVLLQSWDTMLMPGLLQTEDYARAIFRGTPDIETEQVEIRVRARVQRRQILDGPARPMVWALVDAAVLDRPIGGAGVLVEQLRYLLEMAKHPRVTVQIVPIQTACPSALGAAFSLARLPDGTEVVTCDSILAGHVTTAPESVRKLRMRYDTIRADALPKDQSAKLIEEATERWMTQ